MFLTGVEDSYAFVLSADVKVVWVFLSCFDGGLAFTNNDVL